MFGDNDKKDDQNNTNAAADITGAPAAPPATDSPSAADNGAGQTIAPTSSDQAPSIGDPTPPSDDALTLGSPPPATEQAPAADTITPASGPPAANDLLGIKQTALQQLGPLVNHLDQPPEEKFRTLMMMIQASDDQSRIQEAFETAKQIKDDKERAQALLDVINEINYFTQKDGN